MNNRILKISVVFLLVIAPGFISNSFALGMGMGMGMGITPPCGGPFPPCAIPLDSGVILLFIAGATYGGIKIYNSFKKNPA
jgi:hypothetical protein